MERNIIPIPIFNNRKLTADLTSYF